MRLKKLTISVVFIAFACYTSFGQVRDNRAVSFETIIESLTEDLDEELDFSMILENLEYYNENPLNINSASEEELKKLYLLNDFQILNLLEYIEEFGQIVSIYEMNTIEGFSREVLENLAPFIVFGPLTEKQKGILPLKYAQHQLLVRSGKVLQERRGYVAEEGNPAAYEGSREKFYTRYKFTLGGQASAGITAEKDPGEAFFKGSNKQGFDFYSGHVSVGFNSLIQRITVGDFLVRSGQGLVIWQGFASGKSADVLNISKHAGGIRPYTSTDENKFFRGAAISVKNNNLEMQFFASRKKRDANIETLGDDDQNKIFTSLQTSGYHRTGNEISDEKSITENTYGALFSLKNNRLKLGATLLYQKFNLPYVREEKPYNLFRFSGKQNYNLGADYFYSFDKYQFFGEAAVSKSKGLALLQGVKAHLHDQFSASLLFRHFDKNYQALWGDSFSESSGNSNETGFYSGIKIYPVKNITLHAYTDFYRFPWLTYNTMAPANGSDFLVQADYAPSEKIQGYLRYKSEEKEKKITEGEKYINTPSKTRKVRAHLQVAPSLQICFRTRFEYSFYKETGTEHGFMIYQDFIFSPEKLPFTANARIAYINTDSYNTRIYAYENDLLYNYSMPAYFGKSIRAYLNLKYRISGNLDAWFKISNTSFSDRETISSGHNEISGKNITEVKIQIRLRF